MGKVGFIGLGNMGSNMSRNLLKAGFDVTCFDMRPESMREIEKHGAKSVDSIAELAKQTDVVFVMVMTNEQVEGVLLGDAGVLKNIRPGSVVVVCSTISPAQTRLFAEKVSAAGVEYVDCPVSGGKDGAVAGSLVMMASCKEEVFKRIQGMLFAMGSNTFHVSETPGNGQVMKIINQMMISAGMAILSEAVVMGVKSGLNPQAIYEVIGKCTGCSDVFRDKLPLVMKRDFSPRGPVDIFIKDLTIALEAGKENKVPMFIGAAVKQVYVWASSVGHGQEDLGALIRAYEEAAGVEVRG